MRAFLRGASISRPPIAPAIGVLNECDKSRGAPGSWQPGRSQCRDLADAKPRQVRYLDFSTL
jgi:hypothetical protein